jgi:hypothetical protein
MAEETIHLAWGADGAAIEVPDEATHWRVRFLPSKGGNPKVIRRGGVPLLLPITATLELLREAVDGKPGLYRLDPCADGAAIEDAEYAVIEVEGEDQEDDASASDASAGVVGELLKTNREMAQTLMQALATISAQQQIAPILDASAALIHAADGAGMPERAPRRAIARATQPQLTAGAPSAEPSPFDKLLTMLAPFAPQVGAFLMAKLSGDPDIAAAARAQHGAPPDPPPHREPQAEIDEDEHLADDAGDDAADGVRVENAPPNGTNGHNHHPRNGTF